MRDQARTKLTVTGSAATQVRATPTRPNLRQWDREYEGTGHQRAMIHKGESRRPTHLFDRQREIRVRRVGVQSLEHELGPNPYGNQRGTSIDLSAPRGRFRRNSHVVELQQ